MNIHTTNTSKLQDFESIRTHFLKWATDTLPELTPEIALQKLHEEVKEIKANLATGIKDPTEYADALFCILHAAHLDGIQFHHIIRAMGVKLERNRKAKWTRNPDGTYSHVKTQK